jgi:hypothetical protein
MTHHNASFQVFVTGWTARLVWIADFLPNDSADYLRMMMQQGSQAIRRTLEGAATHK